MVIVKITSGLGYQLFQYALGRQLSLLNHSSLYFDLNYYKTIYDRGPAKTFNLHHFKINYKVSPTPVSLLRHVHRILPNKQYKSLLAVKQERFFHFDRDVLAISAKLIMLKGLWQSEKYFCAAEAEIRNELVFNNKHSVFFHKYKEKILNEPFPVSIHIRRGDFIHHPVFARTHGFAGLRYYKQAIEHIYNTFKNCCFFIFSDDRQWLLENFDLRQRYVLVINEHYNSSIEDLELMSLCRHHIIANSAFSWWGAWLNPSKEKMVIAPGKWFNNLPDRNTKDLIPDNWIVL